MWYGERRAQNVHRVRHTIQLAIEFAHRTLENVTALRAAHMGGDGSHTLRVHTVILRHQRMVSALARSRNGLECLLQTYRDDAALTSQIRMLIEEVKDFLRLVEPISLQLEASTGAGGGSGVAGTSISGTSPPRDAGTLLRFVS